MKEADMKRVTLLAIPLITLALCAWPTLSSAATKLLSNGTVKSLSATALTVSASGKDATFSVDAKTKVVGKGVGTKAAAKGKGGRASITDLLGEGDRVNVTYQDTGGNLRAATIELTSKAGAR
jgi:hypothetical protein